MLRSNQSQPDGEHDIEEIVNDDDGEDFIEAAESTDKRKKNASLTAPTPARGGGRRVCARSVGRGGRVTYAEDIDSDGEGSEVGVGVVCCVQISHELLCYIFLFFRG